MAFGRKTPRNTAPVAGPLRRLPGQSVRKELDRVIEDELAAYFFFPLGLWALVFWELARRWVAKDLHLPGLIVMATLLSIYCSVRMIHVRRKLRNLRQGEKAERHVSDLLRRLRDKDYVTFDDICGADARSEANVDHVVVGPGGVFAIETKGYSLFGSKTAQIDKDGTLMLSDKPAIQDALGQAKAAAAKVSEHLRGVLQEKWWVQAVLALPGWKVLPPQADVGVVVVNDETIKEYFLSRPRVLSTQEIRDICSHLDRTARED